VARIRLVVCWVLLGSMAGLILVVVSPLRELLQVPGDLSNYVIHLGVLGASLLILAIITVINRVLKNFMITAGASALGWPVSIYIHELIASIYPTEGVTYVLVFFVLPVTFLVGLLGAIIIGIRQRLSSR
jgi:NADH:ubiquinone oxidoreductase subunit 6 (subunit J)